ncbi:steroid 17-alpha-hydroxylase/17,20 lyase-like isoform X3 [Haliotis rufescens]|uniref:steroid 17-alpha-hydroxylase/17,20 lyase-like isoform X3 n=1 Tax=Haliotis rufescens TaxID=6454 RepID=UPI001EAFCB3A|nr:steroid 17-alpha-hydroxylase/17,20 lyase-like isoform X3 [Haliotis rufescens]
MTNGAVIESTFLTNSFYSGTGYRNRRVLTNVTSSYQSQRKTAKMLECVFNLWPESLITQAIIVGITAGFITYHIFKKRPALPPGPRGWPFIGNLREIQKGDPLELFSTWIEKYGPVITVKFGTWKVVILGRIDVVMEALVQKQEAFAGRPQTYSGDAFTAGSKDIVNGQYGPRWKLHRKLASKALRQYMTSDNLPRKISQSLNISTALMLEEHGPIDPLPFISLAVFNILYGMCFDKLCADTKDETFTFLMDSLKGLVENFGSGFLEDFIPLLRYCPTAKFRRQLKYIAALTEHIKKEMEEHKETFVYGQSRDFADAMLAAQKEAIDEEDPALLSQITDTHVVQTMGDVFFAGIDTTRNTLHWCLLVMALNPDIQKKVQEEVDSVIGRDLNVSLSDRSRLPYTEAVLHETMRIRGIAPMGIPHETLYDTSVGGYELPKGTGVMIFHQGLHFDPDQWDNVNEFRPERFLDASGKMAPKPKSWLPFSAGRRVCLGEIIARPDLHLVLAGMMRACSVSLAPGETNDFKPAIPGFACLPRSYKVVVESRS